MCIVARELLEEFEQTTDVVVLKGSSLLGKKAVQWSYCGKIGHIEGDCRRKDAGDRSAEGQKHYES